MYCFGLRVVVFRLMYIIRLRDVLFRVSGCIV